MRSKVYFDKRQTMPEIHIHGFYVCFSWLLEPYSQIRAVSKKYTPHPQGTRAN